MPPMGWAKVTGESEHRLVINSLGCQAKEAFSPEDPGDSEREVWGGAKGWEQICVAEMPLAVAEGLWLPDVKN